MRVIAVLASMLVCSMALARDDGEPRGPEWATLLCLPDDLADMPGLMTIIVKFKPDGAVWFGGNDGQRTHGRHLEGTVSGSEISFPSRGGGTARISRRNGRLVIFDASNKAEAMLM